MKTLRTDMSIILLTLCLILTSSTLSAQKKNTLEPEKGTFFSLEEALKADPLTVFKLDLSGKKLKEFPAEILKFTFLQQLDLSRNKLTLLPEEIQTLKHLTFLDISSNKITFLPEGIGKMQSLRSLKTSQNKINTLPAGFFNLVSIEILDFYSNPLSFDPQLFKKIEKSLKYIDVRNTALSQEQCRLLQELLPNVKIKFDKGCNCQ